MTNPESDGHYAVYWPRAKRSGAAQPLAPRLASLEGKRIAFLWDFLFRGDEVFETLQAALAERFPGASFVDWREFGNIHGSEERRIVAALPERFAALGVQAAITAMGC